MDAVLDFVAGCLCRVGAVGCGGFEADLGGRDVEEAVFDSVEGLVYYCVYGVDDIVDEGLERSVGEEEGGWGGVRGVCRIGGRSLTRLSLCLGQAWLRWDV